MRADSETAGRSRLSPAMMPGFMDSLDRILLGACAAIWLVALGAGVAATVALVDLGRGHQVQSGDASTPWLLYTVIGVSAAVIVAAVPLLLRARRGSLPDPPDAPDGADRPAAETADTTIDAPTEQLRMYRSLTDPSSPHSDVPQPPARTVAPAPMAALDQLWLRCTVFIASAMGIAMIAIGVATYLMAAGHDGVAWALYGVAAVFILGMPAIPWHYLRQLRAVLVSPAL